MNKIVMSMFCAAMLCGGLSAATADGAGAAGAGGPGADAGRPYLSYDKEGLQPLRESPEINGVWNANQIYVQGNEKVYVSFSKEHSDAFAHLKCTETTRKFKLEVQHSGALKNEQ